MVHLCWLTRLPRFLLLLLGHGIKPVLQKGASVGGFMGITKHGKPLLVGFDISFKTFSIQGLHKGLGNVPTPKTRNSRIISIHTALPLDYTKTGIIDCLARVAYSVSN